VIANINNDLPGASEVVLDCAGAGAQHLTDPKVGKRIAGEEGGQCDGEGLAAARAIRSKSLSPALKRHHALPQPC
jgi:hypothetical protein